MTLTPGRRLGPYEITGAIGAGGMGEVFRARDTKLNRDVAIKVLPAALAQDAERVGRFRREAQILATLNHPNIASIYGLEETDGTVGLVMEFVSGDDLAQRLRSGAIPIDEAVAIARQIAEALEDAHEHGIVHRDLKPANVKVTPEGKVKVLDFGLAKALEGEGGGGGSNPQISHSPTMSRHATEAGLILGTAAYMSPEQARGKSVDKRADVWSFGVVLFEMLTGRRLFSGETVSDTLAAVLTRDPDWTALPPQTPPAVRRLLISSLVREPRQRLRDIGDARLALEAPAETSVAPPLENNRRPRAMWVAGIAIAIVSWLAARALEPRAEPARPVRFSIGPPEGTTWVRLGARAIVSPDGRKLALLATDVAGKRSTRLWVRPLESLNALPLEGTDGAAAPVWSPDATALAFAAAGTLKTIDLATGRLTTICPAPSWGGGSWLPDNQLVFAQGGKLYRVSASGGEPSPLPGEGGGRLSGVANPVVLRGRRVLFERGWGNAGNLGGGLNVYLGSLDRPEESLLLELKDARYSAVASSSAGDLFYVGDHALFTRSLDPDRGTVTPATQIADGVGVWGPGIAVLSVSDNGVLVYGNVRELAPSQPTWVGRDGREIAPLGPPGPYFWLDLSPDGTRVAAERVDALGEDAVWIMDAQRGVSTRLTTEKLGAWTGVWSPDSRKVLYSTASDGRPRLTVQALDARGPGQRVVSTRTGFPTDWSRDGRFIMFGSGNDVLVASPEPDGEAHPYMATKASESQGRMSPDGRLAAFVSNESGRDEVYVAGFPTPGELTQVSSGGGSGPQWRGDSKEIFYLATDGGLVAATVAIRDGRAAVSAPVQLFKAPLLDGRSGGRFDVSADGQRFLLNVASTEGSRSPITVVLNWKGDLASQGKP